MHRVSGCCLCSLISSCMLDANNNSMRYLLAHTSSYLAPT
jgi:hypothetical protein